MRVALPIMGWIAGWFLLTGQAPETTGTATDPSMPTVEEILKNAEDAIAKVKDYTGTLVKTERFGKEVIKHVMEFKFARPFKVYVKYTERYKGREAIYVAGWNDNEVKVHKGSFPDINVNLDPLGNMAMEENHHPVTHFGLESTIKISAANLRKALKNKEGEFKVEDGGTVSGRPVWKVSVKLPKGGIFTTAKDDETLWDIAKRTGQDMFVILYYNADKEYEEADDVDEDDKVFVPKYYGGRIEFVVDKETHLPLKAATFDWNEHLYESYEYQNLKLNVGLTAKDFDPDNSAYDF